MTRVRILPAIAFTSYEHKPGEEVDLRDDIAATWVHAGLAELVRAEEPETPEQGGSKPETTATTSRASRPRPPKK